MTTIESAPTNTSFPDDMHNMTEAPSNAGTIDTSLLRGLEPVMSQEEQRQVTALLTSGDTASLAQASKILSHVSDLLMKGRLLHQRTAEDSRLLEESMLQTHFTSRYGSSSWRQHRHPGRNDYELKVKRDFDHFQWEQKQQVPTLPLPVRMPRLVSIQAFDPNGSMVERPRFFFGGPTTSHFQKPTLTFCDYHWNGKLDVAFTKIDVLPERRANKITDPLPFVLDTLGSSVHIRAQKKTHLAYHQMEELQPGGPEACLLPTTATESQVLLATVANDAAKLGLQPGDVVTHVNGEAFSGTAQDLKLWIEKLFTSSSSSSSTEEQPLEIVVNADLATAQALRLRSLLS